MVRGKIGGRGYTNTGRGFVGGIGGSSPAGTPSKARVPRATFEKAGAFITGDFLGDPDLRVGVLGVDTTTPKLYQCTNATTAAWQVVGTQT